MGNIQHLHIDKCLQGGRTHKFQANSAVEVVKLKHVSFKAGNQRQSGQAKGSSDHQWWVILILDCALDHELIN